MAINKRAARFHSALKARCTKITAVSEQYSYAAFNVLLQIHNPKFSDNKNINMILN